MLIGIGQFCNYYNSSWKKCLTLHLKQEHKKEAPGGASFEAISLIIYREANPARRQRSSGISYGHTTTMRPPCSRFISSGHVVDVVAGTVVVVGLTIGTVVVVGFTMGTVVVVGAGGAVIK